MSNKELETPVTIAFPSFTPGKKDSNMSFDRYEHREILYRLQDYAVTLSAANEILLQEVNALARRVSTLEREIRAVAQAGRGPSTTKKV